MNLYCDPTKEALNELISEASANRMVHNVVMDYDGEVIIDSDLRYPDVDIRKYKFYTFVKDSTLRNADVVKVLHETLMTVFETWGKDIGYYGDLEIAA